MKTKEQLLIEAYDVQDACNLSGVVHAFSRAMNDLRAMGITDTDALNTHPVCVLYASKIHSLTQCWNLERLAMTEGRLAKEAQRESH